ncbi:MAG: glycosyltransferase [Elusimicrobia bacterium]|nr:glycosyltransferase [Elusimicrobiota bacterium]
MRILQVGKFPKEYSGGVERAVFSLSSELAKEHDVEVVTSSLNGSPKTESSGRLTHHCLPTWFRLFSTPVSPSLAAHLRAARCDVIQISFQNPMAAAAYLLARPGAKLVVWYHHDVIRQKRLGRLLSPILSRVLEKADRVVATSAAYAASSPALAAFKDKTVVIPLGVDPAPLNDPAEISASARIRKECGLEGGPPLVLFVGRLVYYKGLSWLLEAMKGLDARLLVIGDGPLEEELKAQAADPRLAGKVMFRKVDHSEPLGRYFHACDVLALPSSERTEAFGLVLLEAMACAKPVVATELGTGTSFVCKNGITGLVVPPRNSAALGKAISSILSDPAMARRMGKAGKARMLEHFTLEKMARSFAGLYQGLLA